MRFVIGSEKMQAIEKHAARKTGFCLTAAEICLVLRSNLAA
jgi:hypothetical protein